MLRPLLRVWTSPSQWRRLRPLPVRRLYHHFTKEHGLAILRLSSAAGTISEVVEAAERAFDRNTSPTRPFLHVVQVHDPDRLAMEWGPSSAPAVPVVVLTAERNSLDIDLRQPPTAGKKEQEAEAKELRLPLVSLTRGPRRIPRPRRAPRTMEDLKGAAAAQEEEEVVVELDDAGLSPLDEESTATVVSVGQLSEDGQAPEVVLFPANDASFPDLPGRSLYELLADAEGRSQPHTFLFANPGSFPLLELMRRLETVLHKRHVVASFTRGVQSQRPRLLGIASAGAGGGADVDVMGRATDALSPALGVAIFGGGLKTEVRACRQAGRHRRRRCCNAY